MPKNKKLSDSEASASSDEEVKKKRGPAKKPQPAASKKGGASKDGESSGGPAGSWCLEGMRFVKVDEFRGRPLISIREYYEKNGQLLPGKKELVALALFDPTLPPEEKSRLAEKIIATAGSDENEQEHSRIIKPIMQRQQMEELVRTDLSSLITKETIRFLDRFDIETSFLKEPPTGWLENSHYNEGLRIVKSLKVVNDCAERGVKLITDFNKLLTKDEDQKQFVLQVVAECRKLYPDASKSTLCKPL
ncbi:hypothetical protein M8J75_003411 [Diaphorina citri]|nr:hypothetical protein M8J75_003411 [Diaphorina citri]